MRTASSLVLCVALISLHFTATTQNSQRAETEQVLFSSEIETAPLTKPVPVPSAVLGLLEKDELLRKVTRPCLRMSGLTGDQIPSSWFVASSIHLGGSGDADLVILPQNQCMNGANVGPFWIAIRTSMGYRLAFSTGGNNLEVLSARHAGYRDLRVFTIVSQHVQKITFRFDGHRYRRFSVLTSSTE